MCCHAYNLFSCVHSVVVRTIVQPFMIDLINFDAYPMYPKQCKSVGRALGNDTRYSVHGAP